jgi:hypothetical protein
MLKNRWLNYFWLVLSSAVGITVVASAALALLLLLLMLEV